MSATMAITAPAQAQQGAAVLTGRVVDAATKKGAADVVVTVTSPQLQGEQIVTTDNTGTYRVPSLPPGVYTLHLDKEGYRAYQRDQVQLRADATIRLDADLLPEGLKAEEVVVVAHAPTVDVGSTTSGANISSDFVSRIPITNPGAHGGAQRTFESVAEAAPGASADLFGTSVNGSSSPENSYVIDGLRTNSSRFATNGSPLSIEFVKEVNVLSSGYMPEYGRSTGGILNVITKSGSNEFHGNVWANWTPGALEGPRKFPYFAGTAIQTHRTLGNVYDIGFDQSGAIIKDKLWYYVGFDVSRAIYNLDRTIYKSNLATDANGNPALDSNGNPTVLGTDPLPGTSKKYQAVATSYQIFAKLDYAINQNNKLALSFAATPTTSGGEGDFSVDPQSGHVEGVVDEYNMNGSYSGRAHKRTSGAYDTVLKWTTEFDNKSKNLETTVGWHHELAGTGSADGFDPGSGQGFTTIPHVQYLKNVPGPHTINDFENVPGCDPKGSVGLYCPVPEYRAGGPAFIDKEVLDTYSARSVLTVLAQAAGHHVIKGGVEFELGSSWASRSYSGGVYYQEGSDGSTYTVNRGYGYLTAPDTVTFLDRTSTRTTTINAGGFIQDSWAIMDKITLNVGLRYDSQFIIGADGKLFLAFPNEISPRIGLIFDPTQHGRSKLFVS
ncbi:MAG TPA: TonB-dependent receptor [Polyangiaceae bacterium]|nr:TonB-dependent receptor [Polyangiaceae bacterium]